LVLRLQRYELFFIPANFSTVFFEKARKKPRFLESGLKNAGYLITVT